MSRSIANGVSRTVTLPAPVEGWDTREALADMPEKRAVILDNWFPTTDKVKIRPGYAVHATPLSSVDFGLITESASITEDLGLITEVVTESYDLGSVA